MEAKKTVQTAKQAQDTLRRAENSAVKSSEQETVTFSYTGNGQNTKIPKKKSIKGKLLRLTPLLILAIAIGGGITVAILAASLLPAHISANIANAFDTQFSALKTAQEKTISVALETGSLPTGFISRLEEGGFEVGYLDNSGNFIAGLRPTTDINLASYSSSNSQEDNSLVLRFNGQIITSGNLSNFLESDTDAYSAFDDVLYGRAMGHYDSQGSDYYASINSTRDVFHNYETTGNIEEDTENFRTTFSKLFENGSSTAANSLIDVSANMSSSVSSALGDFHPVYGCWNDNKWVHSGNCTTKEYLQNYEPYNENYWYLNDFEKACTTYYPLLHDDVYTWYNEGRCYAEPDSSHNTTADNATEYLSMIQTRSLSNSSLASDYSAAALINQAVNANETYQSIQYFLALEENIDKMKAGYGGKSAINPVLNFLTTSEESETIDAEGNIITVSGSPVQSPTLSSVLSQIYLDDLVEETTGYSLDRIINIASDFIAKTYGNTVATTGSGLSINSASSALSISATSSKPSTKNFITDFSHYFVGKLGDATSQATSALIAAVTPAVSQSILFNNAADTLKGITAGEFFTKGAAALGSNIGKFAQGGTIASEDAITAYNKVNQHYLALEAAADRADRSPFDITSQNTFLGSIVSSFGSAIISSESLYSTFSSLASLTSSSIRSLSSNVFADGEETENTFQTLYGNCPALEAIGAKGDVYCNPIIVYDTDYISVALDSQEFQNFLADNLEKTTISEDNDSILLTSSIDSFLDQNLNKETDDEGETIYTAKPNSDLAIFMTFNDGRESTFGTKNSNVYNSLSEETSLPSTAGQSGLISWIKNIWGSLTTSVKKFFGKVSSFFSKTFQSFKASNKSSVGYFSELKAEENEASDRIDRISTGEEFINSSSSSNWDSYKNAQAYLIYSRVLDQIEYFNEDNENKNAISEYFTPGTGVNPSETYLASLVVDHSEETDVEYLSRISGLSEEDSAFVLAYVLYNSFIAEIDYDTYFSFSEENSYSEYQILASLPKIKSLPIKLETTELSPTLSDLPTTAIYDEQRSRSYAI